MDVAVAIEQLSEAIRKDPGPVEPWLRLVRVLIIAGKSNQAISALEQRHAVGADSLSVLYDALGLMVLQNEPSVRSFLAAVPQLHVFQPVVTNLKAFVAVMDEQADTAVMLLRNALAMLPHIKSFAETDGAFVQRVYPILVNQVEQLATRDEVMRYDADEPPVGIVIDGGVRANTKLVVATAADSRYIEKFAESYVDSFTEFADDAIVLNIHAIDPDAAAEECLARIVDRNPNVIISRERDRVFGRRKVYFACSRFLITSELIEQTNLPILFTDIDVSFRRPIFSIVDCLPQADLALFETGHCAPQLRCDAAAVYFAPTEGAKTFLRILRRYLAEKLRENANWMLDQAALWSITRTFVDSERVRYLDLTRVLAMAQGEFIEKYRDDGAKQRLRNSQDV